jgi:hypothetical protein
MLLPRDKIVIVPDWHLQPCEIPDFHSISLTCRRGKSEIFISPCRDEHWVSTDLFKIKIYCERKNISITSIGSYNQFPFYSLFSDRVIVGRMRKQAKWYTPIGKHRWMHSGNETQAPIPVEDVENGPLREIAAKAVSDQEVIDRFGYRTVYILQSNYELFQSLNLPKDLFVCEAKSTGKDYAFRAEIAAQTIFDVTGLNHVFQNQLLELIGSDRYMSIQILCSQLKNWQYLCCGGSSNLLCVIPIKTLFYADSCIKESEANIIEETSDRRYGVRSITCSRFHAADIVGHKFRRGLEQLKLLSERISASPTAELSTLQIPWNP